MSRTGRWRTRDRWSAGRTDKDEREDALLRPENMKLLNTPGVENLYGGEGILTVLVLLPIFNLFRWAKGKLLHRS